MYIYSEIGKIRSAVSGESSLKFICSINQLIEQVRQFGEFIDMSSSLIESHSKYSKKLTADETIFLNFHQDSITRLHIDYENNLLYIFSTNTSKDYGVRVFNAITFTCVRKNTYGEYSYNYPYEIYCY